MKQLKRIGECKRCGRCCTYFTLLLKDSPQEPDLKKYFELHGITFEKDERTQQTRWIIPLKCKMLEYDENRPASCKLHGTDKKPLICRNAPTLKEKNNHERVNCAYKWVIE